MMEGTEDAEVDATSPVIYKNCLLDTRNNFWMDEATFANFDKRRRGHIISYKCIIRRYGRCPVNCCYCKSEICKNDLVIGLPSKNIKGLYGYITLWYHFECALPTVVHLCDMKKCNISNGVKPGKKGKLKSPASKKATTTKRKEVAEGGASTEVQGESEEADLGNPVYLDTLNADACGFTKLGKGKKEIVDRIEEYLEGDNKEKNLPPIKDPSDVVNVKKEIVTVSQPAELLVPLLPFQIDGVTWMFNQERGPIKGGILADEMGMGKTIQTIALLLTSKRTITMNMKSEQQVYNGLPDVMAKSEAAEDGSSQASQTQGNVQYKPAEPPEDKRKKRKKDNKIKKEEVSMINKKGGTLIVSPLAALLQWYNEIKTKTKEDALSVLLYYGPMRKSLREVLHEYDVVLTTYAIVESEFRRVKNKFKVACEHCGRIFMQKSLKTHQKYFCGPTAIRTEKQRLTERKAESGTLILKAHARLFPELKKIVDDINNSNDGTQNEGDIMVEILQMEDEESDEDGYYGNKTLERYITGAFITFGFHRHQIKQSFEFMKDGVPAFLKSIKEGSSVDRIAMDKFELLERFAASETLNVDLFKTTTVATLKELIEYLGLAPYGCKVELVNKVIVFINKMRRYNQNLNTTAKSHENAVEGIDTGVSKRPLSHTEENELEHADNGLIKTEVTIKAEETEEHIKQEVDKLPKYKPVKQETKKESNENLKDLKKSDPSAEDICEGSVLHEMIWHRIVIDEAHRIKTRSSSTSQAITDLRSFGSRWCLTGTPLQNRVGDVYSLLSFLKVYPYAYYFCSRDGCNCESVKLVCDDDTHCNFCGHTRMRHFSYFNRHFLNPIGTHGYVNEGKYAMDNLHSNVFSQIMLRRTKLEKAKDVKLPPMHVKIRRDILSDFERDFYEALYKQSSTKFDTYAKSGTLLHNYAHIFDLLTRLRQAVDHPYLILYGPSSMAMKALNSNDPDAKAKLEEAVKESLPALGNENSCGICFELLCYETEYISASCKHNFHPQCINSYLQSRPVDVMGDDNTAVTCPTCFEPFTITLKSVESLEYEGSQQGKGNASKWRHSIIDRIKLSEFKSSTKIEALLEEVTEILNSTSDKCLVFSQYCSMLDLIAFRLKSEKIQCAVLVGSTSLSARRNMLLEFNNSPNLRVLLISLKAGGEGLNLQIANRIFIMDPWWNPASELQAIQRAHRIGQTKPVYATRFICVDTIEERIIELQEKKMILFDATVCSSTESMAKLSSEDLSFLFKRYNN